MLAQCASTLARDAQQRDAPLGAAYREGPSFEDELRIVEKRVPEVGEEFSNRIVRFVQNLRKAGLRKAPGIAETVDWALALVTVGVLIALWRCTRWDEAS